MKPFRPYDTVELATSGRAACRLCKEKITKGAPRACIHVLHHSRRYWGKQYYHTECIKNNSRGKAIWNRANLSPELLRKAGSDLSRMDLLDLGIVKSKQQPSRTEAILKQRRRLREQLRDLRRNIAQRLGYGDDVYMIFNNKALDALVLDMPTTSTELLKVHGFAKKRTDSLGRFILPIIREYQGNGRRTTTSTTVPDSPGVASIPSLASDDDNDDEVIFQSHETIEDIVGRLFQEAEDRGEVISL